MSDSVAVIGLGYVGLPLAAAFASRGFRVIGIDISEVRLKSIRQGKIITVPQERSALKRALARGQLVLSSKYDSAKGANSFVLCLPTPVDAHGKQNLSAIMQALAKLRYILRSGTLIVLESTVTPGTTKNIVAPLLSGWGWILGENLYLGYSPERIDPGNKSFPVTRIPKIVSGFTPACLQRACRLYEQVVERVVPVSDPTVAEMAKVYENVFRAVNIGLVNELAVICDALGISAGEVVEASATKPFGFMKFTAGAGIGGHCIPLAPYYLAEVCERIGFSPEFTGLAVRANARMVSHIIGQLQEQLHASGKMMNGARVLVVGVTYKPGVADTRNAPGVRLLRALRAAGAIPSFYDPLISRVRLDDVVLRRVSPARWARGRWDAIIATSVFPYIARGTLGRRAPIVMIPGEPLSSPLKKTGTGGMSHLQALARGTPRRQTKRRNISKGGNS
ncbi:MAG: nucleotide sugar dehydrogenase [bacterium JZ-2024 1]